MPGWHRGKARRQADQSTQEGRAIRLPRMVGGQPEVPVRAGGHGPWRVEAVHTCIQAPW